MAPKARKKPFQRKHPTQHQGEKIPSGRAIVGLHAVKESLTVRPGAAKLLWVKEGASSTDLDAVVSLAQRQGVEVREKAPKALDAIAHQHQNLCLFAPPAPSWDWDRVDDDISKILILDQLEDPHNLGAIIRTAWLMGVKGIIATEHRSVGLTPAVHKVASGGVEHVPILFQSNFQPVVERLKEAGFWVYGLAAEGASPMYSIEFAKKSVIVVGSEESGLRKSTRGYCDELMAIPQITEGASYNASVAAAIALAEVSRQHSL